MANPDSEEDICLAAISACQLQISPLTLFNFPFNKTKNQEQTKTSFVKL